MKGKNMSIRKDVEAAYLWPLPEVTEESYVDVIAAVAKVILHFLRLAKPEKPIAYDGKGSAIYYDAIRDSIPDEIGRSLSGGQVYTAVALAARIYNTES